MIFRSENELRDYVKAMTSPTSSATVDGRSEIPGDSRHHPHIRKVRGGPSYRVPEPKKGIIEWFKQSNRWKHLLYGFLVAIIAGFAFTLGCAAGMEFKDRQAGGKWDWIDFGLTVAGAWFGLMLRIVIINALGIEWLKLWI